MLVKGVQETTPHPPHTHTKKIMAFALGAFQKNNARPYWWRYHILLTNGLEDQPKSDWKPITWGLALIIFKVAMQITKGEEQSIVPSSYILPELQDNPKGATVALISQG